MATSLTFTIVLFVLIITMMIPKYTYAYIDPGTGSYLFQMLMAGVLGAAFVIKMAWQNIKSYISNKIGTQKTDDLH